MWRRVRSWEADMVGTLAREGRPPDVDGVADRLDFRLLGPDFQPTRLVERRAGDTTRQLEDFYRGFENDP